MQRARVVGGGGRGRRGEVAVGLVDDDEIGELHDPALEPLQLVAAGRRDQHEEHVDHGRDRDLGLPDADGLDQHGVEPCGLAEQERLTRAAGNAAQRAARRRRPHERIGRTGQLLHARLVAEDRAAAARARRVDREHRDAMALGDDVQPERFDERRLARARARPRCRCGWRCRCGGAPPTSSASASSRWSARVDSTSVIARAERAAIAVDELARELAHVARSRHVSVRLPPVSIDVPGMTRSRHGRSRNAAKPSESGPSFHAGTIVGS